MVDKSFKENVKFLFKELKIKPEDNYIAKNTLLSLLFYCDVDRIDPFYFESVNKKIEAIQGDRVTEDQVEKIFDFSQEKFDNLTLNELGAFFRIIDVNGNDEVTVDEFLALYQATPEFKNASRQQQDQLSKELVKDFELLNPQKKSLTVEEFVQLIDLQQRQSQMRGQPGAPGGGSQSNIQTGPAGR